MMAGPYRREEHVLACTRALCILLIPSTRVRAYHRRVDRRHLQV